MVKIKRVYETPADDDGLRVLIDRLWPRGLTKEAARVDLWAKELAPSDELRKWFGHEPAKFAQFRTRYTDELTAHGDTLAELRKRARHETVTLIYGAKDTAHNNAVVMQALLSHQRAANGR